MLEDDDKVIREADESCTARESRHYQTCEPLIKHLVQVDVRQDWGNYPTLRRASLRVLNRPVFHHARVQPLADEPQQHSVTYPFTHDASQVAMFQGPEKVSDINLENPLARHHHRLMLHDSQSLMRRAAGSKAV